MEAFELLEEISTCHWSKHGFSSSSKSGMLLNNCCESFNDFLREARTKTILQSMEWIWRYVIIFCAKRERIKSFDGLIMPYVVKMVHKGLEEVTNMRVNQVDLHEFEVIRKEYTFVMYLETKVCGCYR